MIPKKNDAKTDPTNYRPISLTNCIARLCERFVLLMINTHLKKKNISVKEQSRSLTNQRQFIYNLSA